MTDNRNQASGGSARTNTDDELATFGPLGDGLREGLRYARPVAAPGVERRAVAGAWLKMRRHRTERLAWFSGLGLAAAAAVALVAARWAPASEPLAIASTDNSAVLAGPEASETPKHDGRDGPRPSGIADSPAAGEPAPAPAPGETANEDASDRDREADLAERERALAERERMLDERVRELEGRLGDSANPRGESPFATELAELSLELERAHQDIQRMQSEFEREGNQLSRAEISRFKSDLRDRWRRVKELEQRIAQKAAEAARRASAVGEQARRRAIELEREASRRSVDAYRREEADRVRSERERRRQEIERVRRLQLRGKGRNDSWRWEWQWRDGHCDNCAGSGANANENANENANHNHNHNRDDAHDHDNCDSCERRQSGDYQFNFRGNHRDGDLDFDVVLELDDETAALLDGAADVLGHVMVGDEEELDRAVADLLEGAIAHALEGVEAEAELDLEDLDEEVAREVRRELERARRELEREAQLADEEVERALEEARRELDDARRELDARRSLERRSGGGARGVFDGGEPEPRSGAGRSEGRVDDRPRVAPAPDLEAYRRQVRESFRRRQQAEAGTNNDSAVTGRATIEIQTTPPGATIVINGRESGTTPRNVSLEPGTHTIAIVGADGVEITRDVTVAAGETLRINDDLR